PKYRPLFTELKRFARQAGIPLDLPWAELELEHQKMIIDGEGRFPGVRGFFNHLERKKYKLHVRVFLSRYRGYSLCSTCNGARLRREAQRIQLATSLGSRLVGTLYVLDEPSIGLHSRDTHRLIKILHDLRELGNTILVVEHDPDIMRASDRILDLGPGAGENGGKVIATGTYEEIKNTQASLTGRYLAEELRIQV